MRGGYGPIGQQLRMARGGAPPVMEDGIEDMNDEMIYEPDLNTMPQGQAMPVHDTGQVQKEYRRMGMGVPPGVGKITDAYQRQPAGPIREQLHSAQHQMMLNDQNTVNQTKRMELAAKKTMIQQKIMQLQRAGRLQDAAKLQNQFDMLMNSLDTGMGALPQE